MTIRLFLLTLAYFASGWLGLKLPFVGTHITLVWLPTGVAVAALFRWGWRVWPDIYLDAFLVNLAVGSSLPLAAAMQWAILLVRCCPLAGLMYIANPAKDQPLPLFLPA